MPIIPLRSDNAYIGASKQSSQGTAVAPSTFFRWLEGTKLEFDMPTSEIWEGDGSRHVSQLIKDRQLMKIKLIVNARPISLAFLEKASMGIGSDTATPGAVGTTLSAATLVNATSITVASNTGLSGTGTIGLALTPGAAGEEFATFALPATGTGPYTLNVDSSYNAGRLLKAHASGDTVISATSHVLTDQYDGDYYTFEVGLGTLNGGAGTTLRVRDCKVDQIKRSGKAGGLITLEVDLVGITTSSQVSPATVSYENHNPFFYTSGTWTLNGSTTGDALAVEMFDITQKNNVDSSIQSEKIILDALIFGNLNVDVAVDLIMQNAQLMNTVYFGSPTGTTDVQPIGSGNLTVVFAQPDNFHNVTYTVPTMHYSKNQPPEPKKDGKHFKQSASATSVSNQSQNAYLLQVTATNAQTAAF